MTKYLRYSILFLFGCCGCCGCSALVTDRLEKAGEALIGVSEEERGATINIINTTTEEAAEITEDAAAAKQSIIVRESKKAQKKIRKEARKAKQKLCRKRVGLEYREVECQ